MYGGGYLSEFLGDEFALSVIVDRISLQTYSNEIDKIILIAKKFEHKEDFNKHPINSSYFGIYIVKQLSANLSLWFISEIKKKVMIFLLEEKLIAIPFLDLN